MLRGDEIADQAQGQLAATERATENAGTWLRAYQDAYSKLQPLEAHEARLREALTEVQALAEEFTSGKWDAGFHNVGRSLLEILRRYAALAEPRGEK